jgi:hypothetical protein
MRAILLGEFGLVLGADGADHGGAEKIGPLAGDQSDAAGGGMDEHDGALADLEGAVEQILHGHALEHHRGGLLIGNVVRQFHRAIGRQQAFGRVAAERHHIGDAVADLDVGNARADRGHLSGAFVTGDEGHADRRGIHADAEIRVDEIDAAGILLDLDLALPRRRDFNIVQCQNVGTAMFVYAHCCDHVSPL